MRPVKRRPALRTLIALGLVTACTLAVQVVFSRLLGSVLAYHFSFLAISLALVGTGAGALLIYVRPEWFDRQPLADALARWSAVYGVLLIVTPLALVRLDYASGNRGVTVAFALTLTLACVLVAAPAVAAGIVVGLAIRGFSDDVGRVYASDLVGAGVGALVVVPLLHFPAPNLLVVLGIVACLAAALFAWPSHGALVRSAILAVGGLVLVAIASVTTVLYLPMVGHRPDELAADIWHPLSRVQAVAAPAAPNSVIYYDRVFAPVPNVVSGDLPNWEDLLLGPQTIGYELTGPGHALVIGGGGGRDIYNALTSGQTVDVIELNSAIRHAVDRSLGELSGSPYSRDGVSTTIGDGRAILAARDTRYDQIHIGFTDTLSANAAQGFALTENNLYTLEAFEEYLDHLAPRGILNVTRLEHLVGDEALRVTVLTMAALERHGVHDLARHVVVIRGMDGVGTFSSQFLTVLARLEPYSDAELATIRRLADERGNGTAFIPGGPYFGPWADLAKASSWREFCEGYELDVCPPTDNRPFFFNMTRPGDVFHHREGYHYTVDPYQLLLLTLVILVVLATVGLLLPLRLVRTRERPRISSLLYFAAIGLGFLLLEIVLIQRFVLFLGFPTYALSIVLFALLIFSGIGSAISARLPTGRVTLTAVLAIVTALLAGGAFALYPLLRRLIDLPFGSRVMLAVVIIAPFGIGLGMPMPLGLARFSRRYPASVAYAWGINGVASVLASVLGVVLAINGGYLFASLVAAGCYALALAHAWLGDWSPAPDAETTTEKHADSQRELVTEGHTAG
jgi:hypothetical protein